MEESFLIAVVPRRLRVRATLQVGGNRVPARGFLVAVGFFCLAAAFVMLGADLERALWLFGIPAAVTVLLVEGTLWGRSSVQIAGLVVDYLTRPQQMTLERAAIVVPAVEAAPAVVAVRRARWQTEEDGR